MSAYPRFPRAALSRGIAGIRGAAPSSSTSPAARAASATGWRCSNDLVEHAVDLVRGDRTGHGVTPHPRQD